MQLTRVCTCTWVFVFVVLDSHALTLNVGGGSGGAGAGHSSSYGREDSREDSPPSQWGDGLQIIYSHPKTAPLSADVVHRVYRAVDAPHRLDRNGDGASTRPEVDRVAPTHPSIGPLLASVESDLGALRVNGTRNATLTVAAKVRLPAV
jgi:hypothetical protein